MPRGPKKHLKRLNAPKHWMLDKLGGIFVRARLRRTLLLSLRPCMWCLPREAALGAGHRAAAVWRSERCRAPAAAVLARRRLNMTALF